MVFGIVARASEKMARRVEVNHPRFAGVALGVSNVASRLVGPESRLDRIAFTAAKALLPMYEAANPFVHQELKVVAFGGNALRSKDAKDLFVDGQIIAGRPWTEDQEQYIQLSVLRQAIVPIAKRIQFGEKIAIVHGNGPQYGTKAGELGKAFDVASYTEALNSSGLRSREEILDQIGKAKDQRSGEVGFWTQAFIGAVIKDVLADELSKLGVQKRIEVVSTTIRVDESDPAFNKPTKPVGSWMMQVEAEYLQARTGCVVEKCRALKSGETEETAKVWREVVASPQPLQIVELPKIRKLLDEDAVVIACGGGGVPVIDVNGRLMPKEGVIDKDRAAAVFARELLASELTIVTDESHVYTDYKNSDPAKRGAIDEIDVDSLMSLVDSGKLNTPGFAGSMGPKLQAIAFFLKSSAGVRARITHPSLFADPNAGTKIYRSEADKLSGLAEREAARAFVVAESILPDRLLRWYIFRQLTA